MHQSVAGLGIPGRCGSSGQPSPGHGRRARPGGRDRPASVRPGEVASELAAVLRPVVHDVGDDQPPRDTSAGPRSSPAARSALSRRGTPRSSAGGRPPRGRTRGWPGGRRARTRGPRRRNPRRRSRCRTRASSSRRRRDAGACRRRCRGRDRRPSELLVRETGRRRQDAVVRPRVEADEGEQASRSIGHPRRATLASVRSDVAVCPRLRQKESTWTGTCR